MDRKERYNILSSYDKKYIAKMLGENYNNMGEIYREATKLFKELEVSDPLFLAQDYQDCKVSLVCNGQHKDN